MYGFLKDIVVLFSFITFFYTFFRFNLRESKFYISIGAVVSLIPLILGYIVIPDFNTIHVGPITIPLVWCFLFLLFLFDISFLELIIYGIASWLIISMVEMVITVNFIENSSVAEKVSLPISIVIMAIMWLTYVLLKRKNHNSSFRLAIKVWVLVDIIMLILMLMMSFFTQVIIDILTDKYRIIGIRLATFGGITLIILIFSMLYYYEKICDIRISESISSMMMIRQKDYYEQLLSKEEETKKYRHDIKRTYLRMLGYCDKEQYEQLKSYINNELGIIDKICRNDYDVGNDTINVILNYYLMPIKEKYEIDVSGFISEDLNIETRDLCVLFANLISNVVEAVCKIEHGKIRIEIEQGKDYIRSVLENTFTGEIKYDHDGNPITSKKDKENHGIGLKNVKSIIKKYDGIMDIEVENGLFKTEVLLKMTVHG